MEFREQGIALYFTCLYLLFHLFPLKRINCFRHIAKSGGSMEKVCGLLRKDRHKMMISGLKFSE